MEGRARGSGGGEMLSNKQIVRMLRKAVRREGRFVPSQILHTRNFVAIGRMLWQGQQLTVKFYSRIKPVRTSMYFTLEAVRYD